MAKKKARGYRIKPPSMFLGDAIAVAKKIYTEAGGSVSEDDLSIMVNNSVKSSSFQLKLQSLRNYGLTVQEGPGKRISLSEVSRQIFGATSQEQRAQAMKQVFVGVDNYVRAFAHPQFLPAIARTLTLTAAVVVLQLVGGLVLAVALNARLRTRNLLRAVFFAPVVLFGKRNVRWMGADQKTPVLRITPFVPREFWVDVHFNRRVCLVGDAGVHRLHMRQLRIAVLIARRRRAFEIEFVDDARLGGGGGDRKVVHGVLQRCDSEYRKDV